MSRPTARRRPPDIPATLQRLEAVHGEAVHRPRFDPMEELFSCLLSQHTTDINSFPAFRNLRVRFADWAAVEVASVEDVADAIRRAGMAPTKAKHLQASLARIRETFGDHTLEPLRDRPVAEARAWLETLPGVGPKTASIVLCFAFGRGAIPVDTHVYRVSRRLGWLAEGVNEAKAHDVLLGVVPPDQAWRFHTTLIQHGRKICRAPRPDCARCPVADVCPRIGVAAA